MLRNSTKITSVLVAAASMASMVPAMAVEKIADKDGTIYRAVAYADGKLYIDGEDVENADNGDGVYYLDNGKYNEVDSDISSGSTVNGVYGEKYLELEDGDYYLDLSTGKVTDDEIRNDDREDAASELRKKIRKDEPSRYDESIRESVADVDTNADEIWEVPAAPYTSPYYQTRYLKFASDKHEYVLNDYATVYTDGKGKYIDADNDLGKVNIIVNRNVDVTTDVQAAFDIVANDKVSNAETIEFTEVGDENNRAGNMKVKTYVKHIATLGSDANYIYRAAALKVEAGFIKDENGNKIEAANQVFTTQSSVCFGSTKNPVKLTADSDGFFYVIQKISKEQGGDKDDAVLPKTTATHFISENKDWRKKEQSLTTNPSDDDRTVIGGETWADDYSELFSNRETNDVAYTIVNGKITKYQTAFETLNNNGSANNHDHEKFVVKTFTLKSTNGFYYIDADKNDDDFDDEEEFATAIDKDGNIWKLDSGKIYKYKNNGDYELMYKCDGGLNELSVYDDKNLVAYNEDDDIYAIVGGKSSTGKYEVEGENDNTTTTEQVGWYTNADGTWSYGNADGTKAIGWLQSPASGLWYYMDANGIMMSNGWVQDGSKWFFLGADGAMKTGWVYTGGAWYYLNPISGVNGGKGAMQTGWIQTGGKWYYCNASGAMLSNTTVDGYRLGADGAWIGI